MATPKRGVGRSNRLAYIEFSRRSAFVGFLLFYSFIKEQSKYGDLGSSGKMKTRKNTFLSKPYDGM